LGRVLRPSPGTRQRRVGEGSVGSREADDPPAGVTRPTDHHFP